MKNKYGQAATLHQLGIIAHDRRKLYEAEASYQKSLKISEKLNDEYRKASTFHELGMIAEGRRKFDEADNLYLQAEAIFEKYDDKQSLSLVRGSLERLHQART